MISEGLCFTVHTDLGHQITEFGSNNDIWKLEIKRFGSNCFIPTINVVIINFIYLDFFLDDEPIKDHYQHNDLTCTGTIFIS